MTNKYCVFKMDIYDGKQIVWEKGKKYVVSYENDKVYFFEKLINNTDYGIDKQSENKKYIVVCE